MHSLKEGKFTSLLTFLMASFRHACVSLRATKSIFDINSGKCNLVLNPRTASHSFLNFKLWDQPKPMSLKTHINATNTLHCQTKQLVVKHFVRWKLQVQLRLLKHLQGLLFHVKTVQFYLKEYVLTCRKCHLALKVTSLYCWQKQGPFQSSPVTTVYPCMALCYTSVIELAHWAAVDIIAAATKRLEKVMKEKKTRGWLSKSRPWPVL